MTETSMKTIALMTIFISTVLVFASFGYLAFLVSANDYAVVPLMEFTEANENSDLNLGNRTVAMGQNAGETFQSWVYLVDEFWFILYAGFSISLGILAYYVKRENLFNLFGLVYIGIMLFLVVLDYFLQVSDWFLNEFVLVMLPFATNVLPKMVYFLDNAGIILTAQIFIYLLINVVDLDFSKFSNQKNKENTINTGEVL